MKGAIDKMHRKIAWIIAFLCHAGVASNFEEDLRSIQTFGDISHISSNSTLQGTVTWSTGQKFTGTIKERQPSGKGVIKQSDRITYRYDCIKKFKMMAK